MVGDTQAAADADVRDRGNTDFHGSGSYSAVFQPDQTRLGVAVLTRGPVPGAVGNSAAYRGRFSHGSCELRMGPCGAATSTALPVLHAWEVQAYIDQELAKLRRQILDTHNVIDLTAGVHSAEVVPPGRAEAAHLQGTPKAVDGSRCPEDAHYSELSGLLRGGEARKMYIVSGAFVAAGIAVSLFRGLSAGLPFLVAGAAVGVALLPGFVALAWYQARRGVRPQG